MGVYSLGSHRRSLNCKSFSRSGGSLCWRVIGGLGRVCMETFCKTRGGFSLGVVWTFLSRWVGELGTVTMDCCGDLERGP